MINVLGMGYAYPDVVLDNKFLAELGSDYSASWAEETLGIKTRFTALPLEYIQETKNKEVAAVLDVKQATSSDLAVQACQMAIEKAGIKTEQIELVLGAGSTPLETSPGEAQRAAKGLGLKIPAYDVYGSSCDFALHLDTLSSWKEDRTPEYILCFSSNMLTQKIDYSAGIERFYFGDAAGACVVSSRHEGKLKVVDTSVKTNLKEKELLALHLYKHLELDFDVANSWLKAEMLSTLRAALEVKDLRDNNIVFVGEHLNASDLNELCSKSAITNFTHWSNNQERGCSLGSAPITALAEQWESISSGQNIVVAMAGAGNSSGYIVFEA